MRKTCLLATVFLISLFFHASAHPVSDPTTLRFFLNQFQKDPQNEKARKELREFYNQSQELHHYNLSQYIKELGIGRWDKVIDELMEMEEEYLMIEQIPGASIFLEPSDYSYSLASSRQQAADSSYAYAMRLLRKSEKGSNEYRLASLAFRKANEYVPGYKDAGSMAKETGGNRNINVLITGLQFDSGFYKGAIYFGSEDRFQDVLVAHLNEKTGQASSHFFTQEQAIQSGELMDWVVYLNWSDMATDLVNSYYESGASSKEVQMGTDSSGNPITQTLYANTTTSRRTYLTSGILTFSIRDIRSNEEVAAGTIGTTTETTENVVDFRGDAGGLNVGYYRASDLANGKPSNARMSGPNDAMIVMNRKILPPLKRKILSALGY